MRLYASCPCSGAGMEDRDAFARWHGALLEEGVYWPPSQFESAFISLAHDDEALEISKAAFQAAFKAV